MSQTIWTSQTNEAMKGGRSIAVLSVSGSDTTFYLFFGSIPVFYESGHLAYHNRYDFILSCEGKWDVTISILDITASNIECINGILTIHHLLLPCLMTCIV